MGSTGSDSFSDYSGSSSGAAGGARGGTSGQDKCGLAFETSLEEVGRCSYYTTYGTVPARGTDITIGFNGVRLTAYTVAGEEIGYLPTKFNYLKTCLDNGFSYNGVITNIATKTPAVFVDITPA